jgi:Flp pilus assembly protein TadG
MKSIRDIRDEMGRRGSIVVLAAVFMIVILAFCSFTVDFGYIMLVDQEIQSAVDSAALAAAQELQIAPDGGQDRVVNAAVDLAAMNSVDGRNLTLLPSSDVEIGTDDRLGLAVYSYPILIGDGDGIGNNNGAGLDGGFASAGGNQNGCGVRLSLTSLSDGMSARNGGGNNRGGNNRRREWERQRNAAVGTA